MKQAIGFPVIALVFFTFCFFTQFLLRESLGQTTPKYSLSDVTKPQQQNVYTSMGAVQVTDEGHIYFDCETRADRFIVRIDASSKKMTFLKKPDCTLYVNTKTGVLYCYDATSISIINEKVEGNYTVIVGKRDNPGYSGDGGDAREALFDGINSMFIDKDGIMYIADENNFAIRKVENGIVTTFVSTTSYVFGVYVDDDGVVFYFIFKDFDVKSLCKWTIDNGEEVLVDDLNYADAGLLRVDDYLLYVNTKELSSAIYKLDLRNGNISRFAGNGKQAGVDSTTFGDGGKASDAGFIAISQYFNIHNGFMYVSDFGLKTIRKISMTDETISLILFFNIDEAIIGPFIDGYNSSDITLHSPNGIVLDQQSGNLYISDYGAVRRISTNNKIEMIVPEKEFNFIDTYQPFALNPVSVSTHNNDLYVVSSKGFIHKYNGSISTMFAGPITASRLLQQHKDQLVLNSPKGLFATKSYVYISDSGNHRIVKVHRTSGLVTNVAGCGTAGFDGDGGLATLANLNSPTGIYLDDDVLYIADTNNHRIRAVNITTGIIKTIAGNGIQGYNGDNINALTAQLNTPTYLQVNYYKELFFSDTFNNRIRQITLRTGIIKTIAGSGIKGFNGDGPALSTHLDSPMGFSLASDWVIYFADSGNNRIRYVDILPLFNNPVTITTHSGTGAKGSTDDHNLPNAIYNTPTCVSILGSFLEDMIIADSQSHRIRHTVLSSTSSIVGNGLAGNNYFEGNTTGSNVKLNNPQCIFYEKSNFVLYIADSGNNRILESNIEGKWVKKFAGGIGDNNLALYSHVEASHVAFSLSGEMYVSETAQNRIRKISTNGIISTIAGTGLFGFTEDGRIAMSSDIAAPKGLYVNEEGELIFVESGNSKVRKINKQGLLETLAGNGYTGFSQTYDPKTSALNSPTSAISYKGQTIVSDSNNYIIRKISSISGHSFDIIAGDRSPSSQTNPTPFSVSPTSMTINSEGNVLYFIDSSLNNIRKLEAFCESGYIYSQNDTCLPMCYGKIKLLSGNVCNNNGDCLSPNLCQCFDSSQYTGFECEIPVCYGEASNSSSVCSNRRGNCTAPNTCICQEGYTSSKCETPICFNKIFDGACGGSVRGYCSDKNQCSCNTGYTGLECELMKCFGKNEKDVDVCNGRGICSHPEQCTCQFGYSGDQCEKSEELWALIGSLIGFVVVVIFVVILISILIGLYRKYYVQRKIIKTDKIVTENMFELGIENDNKQKDEADSFFISINKLDLSQMKKLGSGAYGSVYQTKWIGNDVAVKVFDLNNMDFDEKDFKSEATVLSKLRHPNIISFFGVSSTPTKRYIVMEKMERSLEYIIAELQFNRMKLTLNQKMDIMLDVSQGIEYLHNLKPTIVHRDLKPANILQDIHGVSKLCDFGLSRFLNLQHNTQITNQIGTLYYMSPELFGDVQRQYLTAVDIYSLSIIMWQIIFEIMDPYSYSNPLIVTKLSLEEPVQYQQMQLLPKILSGHRPLIPFNTLEECQSWCEKKNAYPPQESTIIYQLIDLIKKGWEIDASQRPSIHHFNEILSLLKNLLKTMN